MAREQAISVTSSEAMRKISPTKKAMRLFEAAKATISVTISPTALKPAEIQPHSTALLLRRVRA